MKKITQFVFVLLIASPLVSFAIPNNIQERIEYETFKAKTEADLESLKILKTQELLQLQAQIDNQKNLIEQINHQIDSFGNNLTIGSTIITVLLLLIGFFSYRNAKTDAQLAAKQEAQNIAQQEVKTWFDKNANDLSSEIESLRKKLKELEEEVSKIAESTTAKIGKHLSDVLSRSIAESSNESKSISSAEQIALNSKVEELKLIAEAMYKFQDWNTKAFAAYHQKDFNNAEKFWGYASQSSDATELQVAQSCFNKGLMQFFHLNQPDLAITTYDGLIAKFSNSQQANIQEQVARAYINKGITQTKSLNQPEIAIATYEELITKFNDIQQANIQEQVARAYNNKGVTQQSLNQPEMAINTYREVIAKFGDTTDSGLQEQVARAYINLGLSQELLKEPLEEIATYDRLIQKFSNSTHPPVQQLIANAYFNKAVTEDQSLQQHDLAVATYDTLIQKFDSSEHSQVQEHIVRAYFNKACIQNDSLKQPEMAVITLDILLQKFGNNEYPKIQEQVARAYIQKAFIQDKSLHQHSAEIATYETFIQSLSTSEHLAVQEQIAIAYNHLGYHYLLSAKQSWKIRADREKLLSIAIEHFEKGISKCNNDDRPMILGNIAYANWLLNKKQGVEKQLREILTIGGLELYEATIEDSEKYPIALDKSFRVLVEKVWLSINKDKQVVNE